MVRATDVETLLDVIGEGRKTALTIRLADGTHHSDASIDDFRKLANSGGRHVRTLEISARDASLVASVELRDWSGGDTLQLHVSGPEKDVLWTTSKVDEWMNDLTPWYSRIATTDFVGFLLLSFLCILVPLAWISTDNSSANVS